MSEEGDSRQKYGRPSMNSAVDKGVSLRSIKRMDRCKLVDLADSANLYLTPRQGDLYAKAISSLSYNKGVLQPLFAAEDELPALLRSVRPSFERGNGACGLRSRHAR